MMRKLLVFAFGCLLLGGVAARADSLYLFNGQLSTTSGNKAITGQFTWNGTHITSWSLDFGNLAGTCGYFCQLGGLSAFSTIGDGYLLTGHASDTTDTQAGDDSFMSFNGGLTNTILSVAGMQNDNSTLSTQLLFDFNSIPGSFNTNGPNVYAAFSSNGNQNDYQWASGSAALATPEPPSLVLTLTGGLLLVAGVAWYEQRRKLVASN